MSIRHRLISTERREPSKGNHNPHIFRQILIWLFRRLSLSSSISQCSFSQGTLLEGLCARVCVWVCVCVCVCVGARGVFVQVHSSVHTAPPPSPMLSWGCDAWGGNHSSLYVKQTMGTREEGGKTPVTVAPEVPDTHHAKHTVAQLSLERPPIRGLVLLSSITLPTSITHSFIHSFIHFISEYAL